MSQKLLASFSLYTLGQLLTQLLSIALLPLYLKKLTLEDYGIVASLMSVATFFNALMQYGSGPTVMRYYYEFGKNSTEFKGFFTSILVFNFLANIILTVLIIFVYENIFSFLLPDIEISTYIYYIIFYSFFFAFPILNLSLFRVESKPIKFLLFSIAQFVISFVCIYYMVAVLDGGAFGKIKGEFWARVPLFIIGFYLFKKYINFSAVRLSYIKEGLKYGIPLMFQAILWWALYKLDYFLINRELGNEGVGLFNVGFQVSYLLITLGISFSLAWTPHFFSIAEKEDTKRLYGNLVGNFLMFLSFLGLIAILFTSDGLILLQAEDYLKINLFLPYLILGAIFQSGYYMVQQLLFYSKRTILIPIILGVFMTLIITLEYVILPDFGLLGLSIIKCFGFIGIFTTTLLVGLKFYHFKLNFRKVYTALFFLAGNSILVFYNEILYSGILTKIILVLANLILIWKINFFTLEERRFFKSVIRKK
ncbi:lipopolysaccharide biosynthesis protein [Aestuariivivens insulae]|uniref:lipopolysaccharide biosynthesis protein n=1 Tax=Aestuariivivens insulae TaxID=1621988 RepID=UPI001F593222|nr:oligosaccharide flippase family protein [Aestuariivivens insulae]